MRIYIYLYVLILLYDIHPHDIPNTLNAAYIFSLDLFVL